MDTLSVEEERWLEALEQRYSLEIMNLEIGSKSAVSQFSSASEARREMLREAYLQGRNVVAPLTFEQAVAKVDAANASRAPFAGLMKGADE